MFISFISSLRLRPDPPTGSQLQTKDGYRFRSFFMQRDESLCLHFFLITSKSAYSNKLRIFRTLFALTGLVIASPSQASQSSIETRGGFNSEQQQTYFLAGTLGLSEQGFANLSFTHARTPITAIEETDTYYQFGTGAGYIIQNFGFDAGFSHSQAPLTKTSSFGGYFGITYIHVPVEESEDPENDPEQSLDLLHGQVYTHTEKSPPKFWTRAAYNTNAMRSGILGDDVNGKEVSLTLDAYYLLNSELVIGAGGSFHRYDDSKGFFTTAFRNAKSAYLSLLGATLQGLPQTTLSVQVSWQVAQRDTLVPRYQLTEIESSRLLAHTVDFGWRHQFSKNWFLSPTYELTFQGSRAFSGVFLGALYVF